MGKTTMKLVKQKLQKVYESTEAKCRLNIIK